MGWISSLGILIVFVYGGNLIHDGAISAGDFLAFWLAMQRLIWPMLALGFVFSIVQRGRAGYERLRVIFDAIPEVQDGKLPEPIE